MKQGQEFHWPELVSAGKIQKRLLKQFYCLNGLIVGAILSQLLTKRIEHPYSRAIRSFARALVLMGHPVLWGGVQSIQMCRVLHLMAWLSHFSVLISCPQ